MLLRQVASPATVVVVLMLLVCPSQLPARVAASRGLHSLNPSQQSMGAGWDAMRAQLQAQAPTQNVNESHASPPPDFVSVSKQPQPQQQGATPAGSMGAGWEQAKAQLQQQQQQQGNGTAAQQPQHKQPQIGDFVTIPTQQRLPRLAVQGAEPIEPLAAGNLSSSGGSGASGAGGDAAARAFQCGAPLAPCGAAIPPGVTCARGPGWCAEGHFCGWEGSTVEPSRCLPLPPRCGTDGHDCCPSNAERPHASAQDKLQRKPFCRDGSTCVFFAPMPGLNNGDIYAGNKGAYGCIKVPDDCGTGPGKPCCPYLYKVATNPQLNRQGCGADASLFCNYDTSDYSSSDTAARSNVFRSAVRGVCRANARDCGQFGRSCCISTGGSATGMSCGAKWNEAGQRGYCADPSDPDFRAPNSTSSSSTNSSSSSARDSRDSSGSSSSVTSSGGGGSSRTRWATLAERVCLPCPDKTSQDVRDHPSKYWPC